MNTTPPAEGLQGSLSTLIAQVEALDEKATPGPWISRTTKRGDVFVEMPDPTGPAGETCWSSFDPPGNDDALLVAEFRSAAPVLAAALKDAVDVAKFYGDEKNWTQMASWGGRIFDEEAPASTDCGKVARSFLERHNEETP